jgi:hypothetical protein
MLGWIAEFFGSLPVWYWVAGYTAVPVVAIGILVAGWKAAQAVDDLLPVFVAFVLACIATVGGIEALTGLTGHTGPVVFKSIFVGLVTMLAGYGLDVVATKTIRKLVSATKRARAWASERRAARNVRQSRDPKRIMARCRKLFVQAKQGRGSFGTSVSDTNEVIGFDQAGDNLLKILSQLFALDAHIGTWLHLAVASDDAHGRVDDIFPSVSLAEFEHILGIKRVSSEDDLQRLSKTVHGIIEAIVFFFEKLPVAVMKESVFRQAAEINGIHMETAQLLPLPTTTSSLGTVADLETGRIQERILQQLMASAARPAAAEPHKTGSETPPARTKVRA